MTAATQPANNAVIHLDLNGYTVTGPASGRIFDLTGKTGVTLVILDSSAAQSGKLLATADIEGSVAKVDAGNAFVFHGGTIDAVNVIIPTNSTGTKRGAAIDATGQVYVYGGTIYGGQVNGSHVDHGGGAIAMYGDGTNDGDSPATLLMTGGSVVGQTVSSNGWAVSGGNITVQNGAVFNMTGGTITGGKGTHDGGNVYVRSSTFNMSGGTISNGTLGSSARNGSNVCLKDTAVFNMTGGTITGGSAIRSDGAERGAVFAGKAASVTLSGTAKINGNTYNGVDSNLYLDACALTVGAGGFKSAAKIGITLGNGNGDSSSVATDAAFTKGTNVVSATADSFFADDGTAIIFAGAGTPLYVGAYGYQVGYAEANYGSLCVGMGLSGYGDTSSRICKTVDSYGLDIEVLVVTDNEGDTAVICSVEAATINGSFHTKLRKLVESTYGIPAANVMISSNHQHSTPVPGSGGTYTDEHGNVKYAKDFNAGFQALFMDAVACALDDRQVTTLYSSEVPTDGLSYVRNTKAYSGSTCLGMVTDNHIDLGAQGKTISYYVEEWSGDRDMQLVWFDREGKDIVLANFAVHPHSFVKDSYYEASSNFTGQFRDLVSQKYGCHTMYITGAAGDVNMEGRKNLRNTSGTTLPTAQTTLNDYATKMLGHVPALSTTSGDWKALSTGQVKADSKKLSLPANNADFDLIDAAGKIMEAEDKPARENALTTYQNSLGSNEKAAKWIYSIYHAEAIVNRYNYMYPPNSTTVRATRSMSVYAISIGDVSFGGVPYEMFSEDGRAVKDADLSHKATVICYLANGHEGYVPSATHWGNGGYSVDIAYFGESASGTLNSTLGSMLNNLK